MMVRRHAAAAAALGAGLIGAYSLVADAQTAQVQRGKYLTGIGGCNDCHTPGYFFGKPDNSKYLGGSEVAECQLLTY